MAERVKAERTSPRRGTSTRRLRTHKNEEPITRRGERKITGIYKAYDIRGVYGDELTSETAYDIGRAFVRHLKLQGKTILVGNDMRKSSEPLKEALIKGVTDEGTDVIDSGLMSTPLFYYATKQYPGGVMITASHNPKEYNGFKLCKENAIAINYDAGINEIEKMVSEGLPPLEEGAESGTRSGHNFLEEFLKYNLKHLKTTKPVKIVIDAANGMGGLTYKALAEKVKERIEIIPLYFELDGDFPHHEANPLKLETLKKLQETVKAEGAMLGVGIDGDGDRCVFIDENGEPVNSDLMIAVIARALLAEHEGAKILYDLRSSRVVSETITACGGEGGMTRVGHSYIKAHMRKEGALFAGELSGHFYPGEVNYTENTMYVLFTLLNLLEQSGKTLSELVAPLRKYAYSGEINSTIVDADAAVKRVDATYASLDGAEVSHLDGVRVEFPTWWFSVRKSNTEPVVRLIVEADTQAEMEARREELLAIIRS